MASKKTGKPVGRPTEYDPSFCDKVIAHGKGGNSIWSFGAIINAATSSIYLWKEKHPEFSDACKLSEAHMQMYWENLGKAITTGQLKRIKSETPMIDKKGKPILDPKTGEVMIKREYEPATPGQSVFVHMTRNLTKWNNSETLFVRHEAGGKGEEQRKLPQLTPEEDLKEIAAIDKVLAELENGTQVLDAIEFKD